MTSLDSSSLQLSDSILNFVEPPSRSKDIDVRNERSHVQKGQKAAKINFTRRITSRWTHQTQNKYLHGHPTARRRSPLGPVGSLNESRPPQWVPHVASAQTRGQKVDKSKLRPRKEPGLKQDWTNLSFLPPVNFFRTPLLLSVCLFVCLFWFCSPKERSYKQTKKPLRSVQVAWLSTSGPSIHSHIHRLVMSELNHLRKKPPVGGLLLDMKDRRLKDQCQECGVTIYIGPEETSQQTSERRESLRRSIKAAKTKCGVLQRKVVHGN